MGLNSILWSKYPEIFEELELVEEIMKKSVSSRNRLLSKVVDEIVEAGGKRLRPAFAIISCKFGKYQRKSILHLAGALELLHTATLIHDDIIDKAKLRRGKETIMSKYGADMAVYTGDFLFTKAVLMLSGEVPLKRLELVANSVRAMCEGEVDQYRDRFNMDVSVLSYLKKISKKTALLFSASCLAGANIGKNNDETAKRLAKFGYYFGMAFQIRDDINDFLSSAEISGKPVENDVSAGVFTLPVIYALENSAKLRILISTVVEKKNADESEIEEIKNLVLASGGIEKANILLEKYIKRGITALAFLPDNIYRKIFIQLINELMLHNKTNL